MDYFTTPIRGGNTEPVITLFCAFSRSWVLDRWLKNLSKLNYNPKLINLAFIIDIDDPWIATKLGQLSDKYRAFTIEINREWHPNEVRPIERRKRIAEVKNQSKKMIKGLGSEYVLGLEDDTVFDGLDIKRLLKPFDDFPSTVGMVGGVQCGRWHMKMLGVWEFDNIDNPKEAITLLPSPQGGFEEVDAIGFYGYLTTKELYLEVPYQYNGEPWGPDVGASLWLRKNGFHNFVDWETKYGHNDGNQILFPDKNLVQYKLKKINDIWMPIVP